MDLTPSHGNGKRSSEGQERPDEPCRPDHVFDVESGRDPVRVDRLPGQKYDQALTLHKTVISTVSITRTPQVEPHRSRTTETPTSTFTHKQFKT